MGDAHADTPTGSRDDRDFAVEHTHGHCPSPFDAVGAKAREEKLHV
jgi:hypothetical protein